MTRRPDTALPGLGARYPFVCARWDRARPQGARYVYHRGEPICVECASGGDDE